VRYGFFVAFLLLAYAVGGSVYTVSASRTSPSPAAPPPRPHQQLNIQAASISFPVIRDPETQLGDQDDVARPAEHRAQQKGLVPALQRKLRELGCLDGPVDGEWNARTQRAMKLYLERTNARLPVSRPEPSLLAVLDSESESKHGCADASSTSATVATQLPNQRKASPHRYRAHPRSSSTNRNRTANRQVRITDGSWARLF
jgi:hypothetical protein